MRASDYDDVVRLWNSSKGISTDVSDSRESIEAYLDRNPGLSFVARDEGALAGAVLGGHDGRRGYLHHLSVAPEFRRNGIGRRLAEQVIAALKVRGIIKCHLFVRADNNEAFAFWKEVGWTRRKDIEMFSKTTGA